MSTTTPNEDGTGFTEVGGGSYARVAIANTAASFPNAAIVSGQVIKQNGIKFTFPNPTAAWGLTTFWGMFVAASGGLPAYHAQLDPAISARGGNSPVEFDIGSWSLLW